LPSSLRCLFDPKSIAVVGASPDPSKLGYDTYLNLQASKRNGAYRGRLYAVNPRHKEVLGDTCHPDLSSVPDELDLAVIVVPSQHVPDVMNDVVRKGVPAAIIVSGGFSEVGNRDLEAEVIRIASDGGVRVLGPNTLGLLDPHNGVDTFFLPEWKRTTDGVEAISSPKPKPGHLTLLSQSGGVGAALIDYIVGSGAGLRAFVGLGNQADVSMDEVVSYYAEDDRTRAILMYVEGVRDGRKLMEACSVASKRKPIVALKAGRTESGMRAAFTHTASMVGQVEVYSMAFRQGGVIEASTIEELFDAGKALSMLQPPEGDRALIITNGGGAGVIAADACEQMGLKVPPLDARAVETLKRLALTGRIPSTVSPNNPLDLTGSASSLTFKVASEALIGAAGFDVCLFLTLHHAPAVYDDVVDAVSWFRNTCGKPTVACDVGEAEWARIMRSKYEAYGIPAYPTPDRAARALHFLSKYGQYRSRPETWRDTQSQRDRLPWLAEFSSRERDRALYEPYASELLKQYGLPLLPCEVVGDADSAVRVADEIGYPVAMKVVATTVSHKTDVGGVSLGLRDSIEVRRRFGAMMAMVDRLGLRDSFRGILVQKMAEPGFELLIGSYRDPFFGPIVTLGAGGTYTELLRDYTLRVAPVTPSDADQMMKELRISRVLEGYRGMPGYDLECLRNVIVQLSSVMIENPSVAQLEINPFLLHRSGGAVIDAKVLLR
jgi:acetyltransferase